MSLKCKDVSFIYIFFSCTCLTELVPVKTFEDLRKLIVDYGDKARRKLKYRGKHDDEEPLLAGKDN